MALQSHRSQGLGVDAAELKRTILAAKTSERTRAAAQATTGEVLPKSSNQYTVVRQFAEPQALRAERAGVGQRTQRKLDRLAREAPGLHAEVVAGAKSVQRAAIEAGFVRPTVTIALDPAKAAAPHTRTPRSGPVLSGSRGAVETGPVSDRLDPSSLPRRRTISKSGV